MEAKKKALELIEKFKSYTDHRNYMQNAKHCALIAVEEILSICTTTYFQEYWAEVKNELNNM